jgi:5-methylcytosine-specific restriction endonuclease McrA
MKPCNLCKEPTYNKTFCSKFCRIEGTRIRNKINNPMKDPSALEKMRSKKIGLYPSDITRARMSKSQKVYNTTHPEKQQRIMAIMQEKYTSKIAGTSWPKISLSIRKRDSYICQECGEKKKRLIVHHKDWHGKQRNVRAADMNNDPSNLITLCVKCHNKIHRHKSKDYQTRKAIIQNS